MVLNCRDSSAISSPPERALSAGTRRVRSPPASARAASVNLRSGLVKRRASIDDTTIANANATATVMNRNPTTFLIVLLRVVYGAERLTSRYQVGLTPVGSSNRKTWV